MPGISVGSASVHIVPDMRAFPAELRAGILPSTTRVGEEIGQAISGRIGPQISDSMAAALRNPPTSDAARSGQRTGSTFADSFKARVNEALRSLPDVQIRADSSDAEVRIARLRTNLEQLRDQRVGVDIDSATALASIENIKRQIEEVGRETPDIAVRADTARALAQLQVIQDEVGRLNGETATVDVKVDDHGSAGSVGREFSSLAATMVSIAPAAIPVGAALVGGLAGVATVAAAAAGGLGVLALGLSGVSGAVKLLGQEQGAAAQDAAKSAGAATAQAAQEAAAAQQIKSARLQLADARQSAARAEVDADEKVANAETAMADAVRQAAQDRISADREVASAEADYTRSVQAVEAAEQSLADARRQAQRDLQNYADSQVDANLSQQQAVLDLASAQASYDATSTSATATDQDKAQAALDLAKAQQNLVEANERLATSTEDNNTAQKAGVDGAPGVVSATKAVSDAKDAQTAAAQKVADAEAAAAEQQRKSTETVAKAQQALSDAVRDQTRTQQDSAKSVSAAQTQVAQAMQAAATASTGAGVAGVSALAGIQSQLDKVNPATLAFAKYVHGTLAPAFDKLKATAAGGLLPGLQAGLQAAMPLFPVINRIVGTLASTMGQLFEQAGKALNSPFWRQFFDYIGSTAGPIISTLGKIIGNVAQGFAGLLEAFAPVTAGIGGALLGLSRSFASFGAGASKNSGFQAFLGYIRASMPVVVDVIRNMLGVVAKLVVGLAPLGLVIVRVADAVAKFLNTVSPNQLLLITAAIATVVALLGGPVIAVVIAATAAAALLVNNWSKIAPAMQPVLDVFRSIWHFITDQLVPVLVGIFQAAWAGIKVAIATVNAAIEGHKAQLTTLVHAFEAVVGFIVEKLLPILGPVLKFNFELAGQTIRIFIDVIAGIVEAIQAVIVGVAAAVSWFTGPFVDFFTNAWAAVQGAFQAALDWVTTTWSAAWGDAKSGVGHYITKPISAAVDAVAGFFGAKGPLRTTFNDVADWVTGTFSVTWDAVKKVFTAPVNAAIDVFQDLFGKKGAFRAAFTDISDWVTGAFSETWSAVKTVFLRPLNAVVDAVSDLLGAGKGGLQAVFSSFVTAVGKIWGGLKAVFTAPIHVVLTDVIENGLLAGYNWIADKLHIGEIHLPKNLLKLATGGAVYGPGTATSDSIPALLSNGEHVWTAREVAAAGGHAAVQRMRAAAVGSDQPQRYADGGAVISGVQDFIRGTDKLPYVWGATGPTAYDCSGLVSAVYNLIEGIKPYTKRAFSTSNEANYFKPGTGTFTIGVTNNASEQHTAGELAGLKFEARDTQEGIIVGSRARDPRSFARTMHLPAADTLLTSGIAGMTNGSGSGIGSVLSQIAGATSDVGTAVNPLHWYNELKSRFTGPLNRLSSLTDNPFGKIVAGVPQSIASDLLSHVKDVAESVGSAILGPIGSANGGDENVIAGITPANNTKTVVNVAKALGLGKKGAEIGLITALTETGGSMRNYANSEIPETLKYPHNAVGSDHYSAGLFQQQTGPFGNYWGTVAQVMNPAYATGRFFQEMTRRVGGWQHMNSGVVAQDVQGSAYPGRYQGYIPQADQLIAKLYDEGGPVEPGYTLVYNGTGQQEIMAPKQKFDDLVSASAGGGVVPQVYVENPFTGEYLLAQVKAEAHTVVDARVNTASERARRGVPGGALGHLAR